MMVWEIFLNHLKCSSSSSSASTMLPSVSITSLVMLICRVLKNAFQKPAWENSFWKFCSPTNWAGLKGV